ncbi:MAG: hypothetical protein A3A58_03525 [Candidatus Blackburnbacteria bacterium RIFCSPLOWO2_01_FULL_41_27]|uniref:Uncharacterized protein n=2 Tax=Candidatus Blackburniibacteriota TaxID=1817898 RepID=A0A1G1V780_9BACT|nr:MAG: hypothetical protein A3F61_04315 [Candidatus Blackburnbacteria bacterium RIFCSPHIGHO2_12_FULL_41_13b]OGY13695.1 MAG: hypothetical protein A3A58_03525 [Candidatus Blackburnbacteria bacterium RIFCSPLOWO2_01_FULL_41_27]
MGRYALNKSAVSLTLKTLAVIALVFLFLPQNVSAQRPFSPARGEVGGTSGGNTGAGVNDVATIKGLEAVFENVISVALAFAGITLFVMFLIGGFRYMTAGGDAKAVEAAKGTLTHAVLGLVVLILAWIIIQFIEVLTGVRLSIFEIYRQ